AKQEGSGPVSNDEAKEYDPGTKATNFGFAQMAMLNNNDLKEIESTKHIEHVDPLYMPAIEYVGRGDKKYQATVTQGLEGLNIPISAGRTVNANGADYEITLSPTL